MTDLNENQPTLFLNNGTFTHILVTIILSYEQAKVHLDIPHMTDSFLAANTEIGTDAMPLAELMECYSYICSEYPMAEDTPRITDAIYQNTLSLLFALTMPA